MRRSLWLLAAGLAAFARPACAQNAGSGGWVRSDVGQAVVAGNPAAADRIQFGNQFQNQGLDQWCDQIPYEVPISKDIVDSLGDDKLLVGGTFNGNRQFYRYPNGDVCINDQLELKLDLGLARDAVQAATRGAGLYFGGSIDGQSLVTRPMHTANSCKELKRFLDPFDFKTILPLDAKRLSQMDVGELWMIPMTFQVGVELDAADARSRGALKAAPAAAYLSIAASKTADPTITVFRVGPKETRLKLHLDQVRGFNAQTGGVFGPIPAADIGTDGVQTLLSSILPQVLPSQILLFSRQIDSILGVQAGVGYTTARGQQVFLQYTLDPTDPDQMTRLAKVIRGDLSALRALKGFATAWTEDASSPAMAQRLKKLGEAHDKALGLAADMAGIDDYSSRSRSSSFSFPILIARTAGTTASTNHYVTMVPEPHDITAYKLLRQSSVGLLNIPTAGSLKNTSRSQGTQVIVDDSAAAGPSQGKPYLVYTQEWGFLRARQASIGKAVEQADALTAPPAAGEDSVLRLPAQLRDSVSAGQYHKGYLDLCVVLGPAALQRASAASAGAVFGAFDNVLTGTQRALFDLVLARSKPGADGSLRVDEQTLEALRDQATSPTEAMQWAGEARDLCKKAGQLFQDLRGLQAAAADPHQQAEALFRLAEGKRGLSREDFLRVVLQLASPGDVAGDVVLHLDADKTSSSNYTSRYVLNPSVFSDAVLKAMAEVQRSFVAPTPSAPLND